MTTTNYNSPIEESLMVYEVIGYWPAEVDVVTLGKLTRIGNAFGMYRRADGEQVALQDVRDTFSYSDEVSPCHWCSTYTEGIDATRYADGNIAIEDPSPEVCEKVHPRRRWVHYGLSGSKYAPEYSRGDAGCMECGAC